RTFIHPQQAILVEVAVLDAAVLQRRAAVEERGEAPDDAADDLLFGTGWIDDAAAIDCGGDLVDREVAVSHGHIRNRAAVAARIRAQYDAHAAAFRQRFRVSRLLGNERQQRTHAIARQRVLAADVHVASRREKREAKIKRILLQLRGDLVDEAFAQRAPVNVHAAPRRRLQQL